MDIDRLIEIYGDGIVNSINDNIDAFTNNIKYVESRGYRDALDLVNLYPYSFMQDEDLFREKVDLLIDNLGIDYVEQIKNNYDLWGDVDV